MAWLRLTALLLALSPVRADPTPFVIVIDPGHGGALRRGVNDGALESHGASHNNASGTSRKSGTVLEKDLALRYAEALAAEARKIPGAKVVLTRTDDTSVSAMQRAATAVESSADVFLSIHFNAGGGHGPRAYVVSEDHAKWEYMHFVNPYLKRDAHLARQLVKGLEKAFQPYGGKPSPVKVYNDSRYPTNDHGLGPGNLKDGIRALGYARMDPHLHNAAVVLLEMEFLDNPSTTSWLLDKHPEAARWDAARAMAATLKTWRKDCAKFRVEKALKAPGR